MIIPKSIRIKGKLYRILFGKALIVDGDECDGYVDFDKKEIWLDRTLPKTKQKEKLFHEVFHVVVHECHISNDIPFSIDIEEIMADAFADLCITAFQVKWKK